MKYNFDEIHNRMGTYCTQWDYIEDRFHKKNILPFSISDTDFIIPKPISNKITEVSKHQIYGYTRWNHDDFKLSICDYFKRRQETRIDKEWIVYSPSVMYSVSLLIRLLSQKNDKILTFNPMYDSFFSVIEDNERKLVSHFLENSNGVYKINFELLERQLEDCQILLLCTPHNPTGKIFSDDEMKKIISICKTNEVKIISDEIHMDIQLTTKKHNTLMKYYDLYQDIYTASSSSKTFNTPGLIGSYVIIPNSSIKEGFLHQTRKVDFLNSASIFGMYATMVGYNECDDYIDQLNEYIIQNMKLVKSFIEKELPDFKFQIPESTYLAWIDARNVPFSSTEIQDALVNVGEIGIMDGGVYGEGGQQFLRMNIGCPQSKVEEGLKRFKKAMQYLYNK